jgi:hypothetical protein
MNKAEFLAILSSERARLERLIEAVGPARMETPGVSGTYSTKNLLAHLMAYEEALVKWLVQAKAGRVYVDDVLDQPDLDGRNAAVYEANRHRSPGDVVGAFERTFDELQRCVRDLSEQELTDAEMTGWFVVPRWQRKQELWKCIANDSYEHHDQHIPNVERWLSENESQTK